MQVFVLSLADAVARRAPLIAQLQEYGINYTLWPAVDGRNGLSAADEARIDRIKAHEFLGRPMSDAEFGCALSHHDMYQDVVTQAYEHAVILEDDAILQTNFAAMITDFQLKNYDLLLLDHWRAHVDRWRNKHIGAGAVAHRALNAPLLTTGYIISQIGAQKMIAQSAPIAATADWPCDITAMRTYAADPRLVDHPDFLAGTSSIREERSVHQDQKTKPSRKPQGTRPTASRRSAISCSAQNS